MTEVIKFLYGAISADHYCNVIVLNNSFEYREVKKSHVSPSWTLITLAFTVVYDGGKPDERETWLFVTFCNWLITFVILEIRIFWNTFDDDFEGLVSQVPYMTESNAVA